MSRAAVCRPLLDSYGTASIAFCLSIYLGATNSNKQTKSTSCLGLRWSPLFRWGGGGIRSGDEMDQGAPNMMLDGDARLFRSFLTERISICFIVGIGKRASAHQRSPWKQTVLRWPRWSHDRKWACHQGGSAKPASQQEIGKGTVRLLGHPTVMFSFVLRRPISR